MAKNRRTTADGRTTAYSTRCIICCRALVISALSQAITKRLKESAVIGIHFSLKYRHNTTC